MKIEARVPDICYGLSVLIPSETKLVFRNLKAAFISEFQNSFPCVSPFGSFWSVKHFNFWTKATDLDSSSDFSIK